MDDGEALRELLEEQAALRRVATLVASERDPARVFSAVTEEAGRRLGAQTANLSRFEDDGRSALVVGEWHEDGHPSMPAGALVSLDGPSAAELVRRTGEPARVDDFAEVEGSFPAQLRALGIASAIGSPVRVAGRLWGALMVSSQHAHSFPPEAEQRLEQFSELVATALADADAREKLAASRARIVEASYEARRRIERDLHDGAQQQLVGLALDLRRAEAALSGSPEQVGPLLAEARTKLDDALAELRELARGIHPAVLTDRGLEPAIRALADRCSCDVEVKSELVGRLPRSIEAGAYFVVSEALANVAKHAQAGAATVRLWQAGDTVHVTVADDGIGGAEESGGSGLRGLRDRVEALGGRLELASPKGAGTTLAAALPIG